MKVSFPADYRATDLAGKDAEFAVTVKEVASPKSGAIDDELAKKLGMESLDKLKEAIREQTDKNYQQASRMKLKRALLDALDETHKFDLPPTLVEQEFANIWAQVEREIANGSAGEASPRTSCGRNTRRSPSAACASACSLRRSVRRTISRSRTTKSLVPSSNVPASSPARSKGLGILPEDSGGSRRTPRADLRGEGGRLHRRARQGDREEGLQGRALRRSPTRRTRPEHRPEEEPKCAIRLKPI